MAETFHLPKPFRLRILRSVDQLFERLKARALGPHLGDKTIAFSFRRDRSLPGLYEAASREARSVPDVNLLDQLLTTCGMYLDAAKARVAAEAIHTVESVLQDSQTQARDADWSKVMEEELGKVLASATTHVKTILDSEAQQVRAVSQLDGLVKLNTALGISDPTVFFIVVHDGSLCKECRRLHLLEDGVTPRLWKLSQVGNGHHHRGDEEPKVGGLHPHCRCTMATLTPGFGFDGTGSVRYIAPGHDEYAKQKL